ncbi:MAG: hypothetical protein HOO87_16230, partial [Methyloglobulus sp.]|nr:hypothetical protein [Methyloglobulus sp.]
MNNVIIRNSMMLILTGTLSAPAWSLTVEQRLAALESANTALKAQVTSLQTALNTVKNNSVLKLNGKLRVNAQGDALFTGVNVQVVNGQGSTLTANGKGNLVIGYNEVDPAVHPVCSNFSFSTKADCTAASAVWSGSQH